MPDISPLSSFDIADVVSLGGALGGVVDFCRQLSAEGSIRKKTFVVKYDKTPLGVSSAFVYLATSVIIGVGGAFGVQFLLIMLKSFSPNHETSNELLIFSISIIAGIGARSLIPRISDRLQEQLFKVQQEAEAAVSGAKDATRIANEIRTESTEFNRIVSTLRAEAPESEVDDAIRKLEGFLRESEKHGPTSDERTETIWLGRLYKKKGNYRDAVRALQRFLTRKEGRQERDKDYADVLYNKACYLSLDKRFDEALAALRETFALSPSNKEDARGDRDFQGLRDDPERGPVFAELVKA